MKKEIVIFISNSYADWEIAFISAELRRAPEKYKIQYVAVSKEPVTSLGGLTVIPDYAVAEYVQREASNVSMVIVCGGDAWKEQNYDIPEAKQLVDWGIENNIPMAAICDATTFLAKHSYLNTIKHTGNSLEYMVSQSKDYTGQENFIEKQCVRDGQWITANGFATLEFAREIMKFLQVSFEYYSIDDWYNVNKTGIFVAE